MSVSLMTLEIHLEGDVVLARQRGQIAGLLGFAHLDQTRIATATSEVARNTVQDGGGGRLEFLVETGTPRSLKIVMRECGTGLKDLQAMVHGQYSSPEAVAPWVRGAQRMMDQFTVAPGSGGGATLAMAKKLPLWSSLIGTSELGASRRSLPVASPKVFWKSSSSRIKSCSRIARAARATGGDRPDALARARRNQPRCRRPLYPDRRQHKSTRTPLRIEIALSLRDEPRAPLAAQFDQEPDRLLAGAATAS